MFNRKKLAKLKNKINENYWTHKDKENELQKELDELKKKFNLFLKHLNLSEDWGWYAGALGIRHDLKGFKKIKKCEHCGQGVKNDSNQN